MDRKDELQELYAIITYFWKMLKERDWRNPISESEWDAIVEDYSQKQMELEKKDFCLGKIFKEFGFATIDYIDVAKRKRCSNGK